MTAWLKLEDPRRVEKRCLCGTVYWGDVRYPSRCRSCKASALPRTSSAKRTMLTMRNSAHAGVLSHTWKGGHKSWQVGKLGRDKDGLSWKQQRRLAWERDSYTCQHCGKRKDSWRPDVHHIKPYRLSFSHSLDNLICLCRRCHKKAEALIVELWGGHRLLPPKRTLPA